MRIEGKTCFINLGDINKVASKDNMIQAWINMVKRHEINKLIIEGRPTLNNKQRQCVETLEEVICGSYK